MHVVVGIAVSSYGADTQQRFSDHFAIVPLPKLRAFRQKGTSKYGLFEP